MSDKQNLTLQDAIAKPADKNKPLFITRPLIVCLLAGVCCLLWGSAFPCVKIGYQLFHIKTQDTDSQLLFAGCRFALAGLLVLLFALIQRILAKKNTTADSGENNTVRKLFPCHIITWKHIVILSFFQTIAQYFFFYIGLAHTSGVKASIIVGTNVFVAILTASLIFHQEKLTLSKMAGCLFGFLGVVLVNLGNDGLNLSMQFTGEGFIFLSTIAYAFSSVIMKNFSQQEDPVLLSGWQFFIGGLVLIAAGGGLGGHVRLDNLSQAVMLLYLSFISAGAYTLWSILIKYNPVSQVAVYGFMNPVFGVILSWFLLQDASQVLGINSILALILVCFGIYVVNRIPAQTDPEAEPQKEKQI